MHFRVSIRTAPAFCDIFVRKAHLVAPEYEAHKGLKTAASLALSVPCVATKMLAQGCQLQIAVPKAATIWLW